jgi:cobalt/nickel transport system permease protein
VGSPEARDRALLGAWLVAAFALSAVTRPALLAVAWVAAAAIFHRGLARTVGRVVRLVLPVTAVFALGAWGFGRLATGAAPPAAPLAALVLRTTLIAFVTAAVLDRVRLLAALAPWPTATRLLVVTLAQIHALRLVATESADGLRSRLPRRPRALDVLRNAGGITAALLALAIRNARDVSDAMRSRGF